jgi:hypothetical protein
MEIRTYIDSDMKARSNYHVILKIDAMDFMRKHCNKISTEISQMDFDEMKEYFSKGIKKQAADKK